MRKKILNLFVFAFSCFVLSGVIINVRVMAEENVAQDPTSANGSCQYTGCWPWLGSNKVVQALRLTVYDGKSRKKVSTGSVDLINNKTHYNNINGKTATILGNDGKPSYLNGSKSLVAYKGTVSLRLMSSLPDWYGNSIGDIKSWWVNLSAERKKEILGWAGYTRYAVQDVLVVEPVTLLQWGGKSYWGSAYELVKYQYDIAQCTGSTCSNAAGVGRRIMAAAVHLSTNDPIDPYGFITDVNGSGILWRLSDSYVEIGKRKTSSGIIYECFKNVDNCNNNTAAKYVKSNYGYGIGAFWIKDSGLAKSCDININNNTGDDKKYNWTYWDDSCDVDGDGIKEGCWKKQKGGCCDQVELTDEILNKYPECASCKPSNKTYINGKDVSNLDAIICDNNDKKITNYRGTGSLNETTPKYCLANNNLLVGTINGKRYGCEITDSLLLPKEYGDNLKIGQYFVWPTSKTLQSLGNFDMRYPVTRTSNVTCVAYQYTSDGKLQYVNLSASELETLKKRFKVSGNLNLIFNSNNNGKIIEESQSSSFKNTSNNLFTGNINTVYTLEKINKTNGVYAYYDQEKLQYTNAIIVQKINKYIQYGFPIIPFGNYGDKSININYGINFDNMGLSKLKSYSGSYICSKKGKDDGNDDKGPTYCKCEPGTVHEGLDLTPYFNTTYDSWTAECSRVRDLKCNDPDTPIKCPNDDSLDMTNCVKNKIYGGANEKEAYDLCVAQDCKCVGSECNAGYCEGSNCGLDIIYRPIFLNKPFPSIRATKRVAGANWGGKNSLNNDGLGTKYITSTASKMYQGEPMYSFTLTPKALNVIKKYNDSHGYDDFNMTCGKNQYCIGNVLRGDFGEYFTGGTCQLQTNAKVRGKNDCRLTALER